MKNWSWFSAAVGAGVAACIVSWSWFFMTQSFNRDADRDFDTVAKVATECMHDMDEHFTEFHPDEWAQARAERAAQLPE